MDEYIEGGYLVSKAGVRRVRTMAGARFFKLPIGAPIPPAAIAAAKAKYGDAGVKNMLRQDSRGGQFEIRQKKPGDPYDVVQRTNRGDVVVARGLGRAEAKKKLVAFQEGRGAPVSHPDDAAGKWRAKGWNGISYNDAIGSAKAGGRKAQGEISRPTEDAALKHVGPKPNPKRVSKSGVRRVRTAAGARFFGLPIGSPITGIAMNAAIRRHGPSGVMRALDSDQNGVALNTPELKAPVRFRGATGGHLAARMAQRG